MAAPSDLLTHGTEGFISSSRKLAACCSEGPRISGITTQCSQQVEQDPGYGGRGEKSCCFM